MQRRTFLLGGLLASVGSSAVAGDDLWSFGRGLFGRISKGKPTPDADLGLSARLADTGLRDALRIGVDVVVNQLGVPGGFWADGKIRIPLPGVIERVRKNVSFFGLSGPFDELHSKINQGAENAIPAGKALLMDAVSTLSVVDAVAIVQGPDTGATEYLRARMGDGLAQAFRPLIEQTLDDTGSLKLADRVGSRYGFSKLGGNLRGSLSDHVVEQTLRGLFYYLGEQEKNIRANPFQFASKTVQQVFGR